MSGNNRKALVTALTQYEAMTPELRAIRPQLRRLVLAYLEHMDIKRAAEAAGMKLPAARSAFGQPHVMAALRAEQEIIARACLVTAGRLAQELGRIATADLRQLVTEWGTLKPVEDWPDEIASAVASFKTDGQRVTEVKLWPKVEAARLLAQHLGMLHPDEIERRVKTLHEHEHRHVHEIRLSDEGASVLADVLAGLERPGRKVIDVTPDG